jgi:predicted transglutaminase-like protease
MWYLPDSHCVSSQEINDRLVIQFNDRPVNETVVIYNNKKINAIKED